MISVPLIWTFIVATEAAGESLRQIPICRRRFAGSGAQLPAEIGALFLKAPGAALPEVPKAESAKFESHGVSAETSVPRVTIAVRRADALGQIAERFLQHGIESLSGGDRHQIVVHVDIDTLREHTAGRCELEDGAFRRITPCHPPAAFM